MQSALIYSTRGLHSMLLQSTGQEKPDSEQFQEHLHATHLIAENNPRSEPDIHFANEVLINFVDSVLFRLIPIQANTESQNLYKVLADLTLIYHSIGAHRVSLEVARKIRGSFPLTPEEDTELACFIARLLFRSGYVAQSRDILNLNATTIAIGCRVKLERSYQDVCLGSFSTAQMTLQDESLLQGFMRLPEESRILWQRLLSCTFHAQGDAYSAQMHLEAACVMARHNEAFDCSLKYERSRQILLGHSTRTNKDADIHVSNFSKLALHVGHWLSVSIDPISENLETQVSGLMDTYPTVVSPGLLQALNGGTRRRISAYIAYLRASRYASLLRLPQGPSWHDFLRQTSFITMEAQTILPLAVLGNDLQPEWLLKFLRARFDRRHGHLREARDNSLLSFEMLLLLVNDPECSEYKESLGDKLYEVSREAILASMDLGGTDNIHLAISIHDQALSWRQDLRAPSIDELRDPLGSGETLIRIALCEGKSFIWISSDGDCVWKTLPKRGTMKSLAMGLSESCAGRTTSDIDPYRECRLFGSILFDGLDINWSNRILIVSDTDLADVPWTAVKAGSVGESFVSFASIAIIPSVRAVLGSRRMRFEAEAGTGMILFSEPTVGDSGLSSLPFSREEAATIQASVAGQTIWNFSGRSDIGLLKSLLQKAQIIHFSSHGVRDSRNEQSIFLRKTDAGPDELLTCRDVRQMSMSADLVILNLCESGLGTTYFGDGIGNLPRAFIEAGVQQVIATLWPVEDMPAMLLMCRFYTELGVRNGVDYGEALRRAQKSMSLEKVWSSPQYWAAYQLIGIPSTIPDLRH